MNSKFVLGLSVFGLTVLSLQADTLRLKDGRVITGTFEGATRNHISFRRDGGSTDRYDVGSVDTLSFGAGPYNQNSTVRYDDRRDSGRYNNQGQYNQSQANQGQYNTDAPFNGQHRQPREA